MEQTAHLLSDLSTPYTLQSESQIKSNVTSKAGLHEIETKTNRDDFEIEKCPFGKCQAKN